MSQVGRPSSARYPAVSVRHIDTGRTIAWSDGTFAGDVDLVTLARRVREFSTEVTVGPRSYPVDNTPESATAIMLSICYGRGEVVTERNPLADAEAEAEAQIEDVEGPVVHRPGSGTNGVGS